MSTLILAAPTAGLRIGVGSAREAYDALTDLIATGYDLDEIVIEEVTA